MRNKLIKTLRLYQDSRNWILQHFQKINIKFISIRIFIGYIAADADFIGPKPTESMGMR